MRFARRGGGLLTACPPGGLMWYHGDLDWPEIAMANRLVHALDVRPWQMTAADYRSAIGYLPDRLELAGVPVDPEWTPFSASP
jgi:uncharacterized protein DUF2399